MKRFKDFNIKPEVIHFTGDKIKLDRLVGSTIKILGFRIDDSIAKPGTKCLTMHIEKNNIKHVVFTSAKILMQEIKMVPEGGFPFETVITKENDYYEFT